MSKHTPGPWVAYRDAYYETWSVEGGGDVVADLWRLSEESHTRHPHFEDDGVEANAQLIAAAPELLSACETALECLVDWDRDDGEAGDALRAAIAKAKGEPS